MWSNRVHIRRERTILKGKLHETYWVSCRAGSLICGAQQIYLNLFGDNFSIRESETQIQIILLSLKFAQNGEICLQL